MNGFSGSLKRLIANLEEKTGAKMTEEKRAELYTKIRAASLSALTVCPGYWRIGAHSDEHRS
jgi:hypothetical protein